MATLSRTWKLAKASWAVINHDRELLVIPIISGLVSLVVGVVFVIPMISMGTDDGSANGAVMVLGVLFVMALSAVSVVFQGALVFGAHERFTGGDPTIRSAIGGAVSKLHRLIPWAILTATVGLLLRLVREEMGFVGRILASLLDTAWQVLTYLVVPIVMFEDLGPIQGVKRSTQLFKGTWGENLSARVGFGLLGFVAIVPGIAVFAIGASTGLWPLFVIAVLWIIAVVVVLSAMNAVFQTALYLYATGGEIPSGFAGTDLTVSFGPKRQR